MWQCILSYNIVKHVHCMSSRGHKNRHQQRSFVWCVRVATTKEKHSHEVHPRHVGSKNGIVVRLLLGFNNRSQWHGRGSCHWWWWSQSWGGDVDHLEIFPLDFGFFPIPVCFAPVSAPNFQQTNQKKPQLPKKYPWQATTFHVKKP